MNTYGDKANKQHTTWSIVFAFVILSILLALPAHAQDTAEPPITGTASTTLYLPAVARNSHTWFTDSELEAAMIAAGYDVQTASMHTVCILDPSAVPPYLMRYTSCEQYYVDGQPTEGTDHYIWYLRMGNGIVTGLEVGQ